MGYEPVRIALVGAGRMGRVHLDALNESALISCAGVVEPLAQARERLTESGLHVYADVDGLLAAQNVDGVLIAAPSDQHPALATRFIEEGIAVLCEKPLGVRPQSAAAVAKLAQERGVLLQIGYWRRFVPELRQLQSRIAGGELGQISQLSCMQWDAEPPSEEFRSHSGGIAVDMGVHEFDQARWLLGQEFSWIEAAAAGISAEPRAAADPDSATILAQMSGGTAVTISLGRRFPQPDSCWVEVWGTEGYERLPFMWAQAGDEVFRTSMRLQAEAFAEAVRGGPRRGADASDAVAALTAAGMTAEAFERRGAAS
jgi:myo-inositol 2-dehydrogenase/D-chiro-inositol 1-dehydrogenase